MKRKDLSLIAGIALCTLTVLLTVVWVGMVVVSDFVLNRAGKESVNV